MYFTSRPRSVIGLSSSGTWGKFKLVAGGFCFTLFKTTTKRGKHVKIYTSVHVHGGSRQNTCACLLACVVALWSARTYCCIICTLLLCRAGRLQAVRLCLRYVDTVVIGAWFVPSLRGLRRKSRCKNERGGGRKRGKDETIRGSVRTMQFSRRHRNPAMGRKLLELCRLGSYFRSWK